MLYHLGQSGAAKGCVGEAERCHMETLRLFRTRIPTYVVRLVGAARSVHNKAEHCAQRCVPRHASASQATMLAIKLGEVMHLRIKSHECHACTI